MSKKPTFAGAVLVAVLLVFGVAAAVLLGGRGAAAVPASQVSQSPEASRPAGSQHEGSDERAAEPLTHGCCDAPAGSMFRYRVNDRIAFELHSRDGGAQDAGTLDVRCHITTTVLDRRQDGILVQHAITDLELVAPGGQAIAGDPIQQSFAAAAREPVLARLDLCGLPVGYGFADGLDGDQRNFLRGLLAVFACSAPAEGDDVYRRNEQDTTGEYVAEYRIVPAVEADEVAVQRVRLHYLAIGREATPPEHQLRGAAHLRWSLRHGWLAAARLEEGMTLQLPLFDLRSVSERRAEAVLVDHGRAVVEVDLGAAWRRAVVTPCGRQEQLGAMAVQQERDHWRQRLQGIALEQLLADLDRVLARPPVDQQALDAVFQQLQWRIRLDAEAARRLGELLLAQQLGAEAAAVAAFALGAAGTPAAQEALVAVRSDRAVPVETRRAATVAALQLGAPSQALLDGLARDAGSDDPARDSAMLVLGALMGRSSEPLGDGRQPLQALLAMERDAAARGELSTWVLAAGNTRTAAGFAAAERCLGDPDAAVRAAACVALRHAEPARAVPLLIERALHDGDFQVRREAIGELGRRSEPAARAALERAAQQDPVVELRNRARELLAQTGRAS